MEMNINELCMSLILIVKSRGDKKNQQYDESMIAAQKGPLTKCLIKNKNRIKNTEFKRPSPGSSVIAKTFLGASSPTYFKIDLFFFLFRARINKHQSMDSNAASKPLSSPGDSSTMFRPPVNRAMRVLDRSFFKKSVPISSATVLETKNIAQVRKRLSASKDLLELPRYQICTVPNPGPLIVGNGQLLELSNAELQKRKCLLLKESIKHDGKATSCDLVTYRMD